MSIYRVKGIRPIEHRSYGVQCLYLGCFAIDNRFKPNIGVLYFYISEPVYME